MRVLPWFVSRVCLTAPQPGTLTDALHWPDVDSCQPQKPNNAQNNRRVVAYRLMPCTINLDGRIELDQKFGSFFCFLFFLSSRNREWRPEQRSGRTWLLPSAIGCCWLLTGTDDLSTAAKSERTSPCHLLFALYGHVVQKRISIDSK